MFEYLKTVPAEEASRLNIMNFNGQITITGESRTDFDIKASKIIRADNKIKAEEYAAFIDIDVRRHEKLIDIETKYTPPPGKTRSWLEKLFGADDEEPVGEVNFELVIPQGTRIDIRNNSGNLYIRHIRNKLFVFTKTGNVTIQDVQGDVILTVSRGDINVSNVVGDMIIESSLGNIYLSDNLGEISIKSASGAKTIAGITGQLIIEQASGDITIDDLDGYVRIKSGSGNMDIEQQKGNFNIETLSGDVRLNSGFGTEATCFVRTLSGSIRLNVPTDLSANLNMETGTGNIDAGVTLNTEAISSNRLVGILGRGGPEINLISETGNISLVSE